MSYDAQDRGSADDYAKYFAGMNQSMQQKVALTTAHFPPQGLVADMGSGSGQATYDLAALYSGLDMVGVDINPKSVAISAQTFQRKNLRFVEGDIADKLFADGSLAGILNSSVLHHVTSFNGFSLKPVHTLLDNQVASLAPGGVLIIRDFVVPRGPSVCDLELPNDTAELFERFARTWKSSIAPMVYETLPARSGHKRFRLPLRAAAEFVLRKDYQEHWETELLEEYTYFSQADFERAFIARGLRIVVSVELFNPWIVENRFAQKFRLTDVHGAALPFPPTNYLIVGEKVSGGVRLTETSRAVVSTPKFLKIESFERNDGRVFDLAVRPNQTLDVLPWFEHAGRLFIVCKRDFPRPISRVDAPDLIGMQASGYVTEPIAAIVSGEEDVRAAIARVMRERAGIETIHEIVGPTRYFTSPGGINERVDSYLCRIDSWLSSREVPNYSSFSSSGSVRYLDATQTLRACHVGGMFDARLELNIYRLLVQKQRAFGPWIGAAITLHEAQVRAVTHVEVPQRRVFNATKKTSGFLEVRTATFTEEDAQGRAVSTGSFEYVTPRDLSHNTLTLLPAALVKGVVHVGLELRDLPAVQCFESTSAILTVPACRLPQTVLDLGAAEAFANKKLAEEFGLRVERLIALGGRYYPTVGVTPEVVYPYVACVSAAASLQWIPLGEAMLLDLRDAHLMTSLYRLHHAVLK